MFFFSLFVYNILQIASTSDIIIWRHKEQSFQPLFNFSVFAELRKNYMNKIRDCEFHNFQRESVVIAYYQEPNIVNYIENDTKISGAYGEIWTILSNYLNFTLVPYKLKINKFGTALENGSFDGILGLIQRNESQIVARIVTYINKIHLLDFTIPLWKTRYYIYIKPEWKHDKSWIYHLFTIRLWYSYFILLLVLSIAGYIKEKYSITSSNEQIHFNLQDHMFYTIAIASQGCISSKFYKKSRFIYLCTSIFSWMVLIAFSSHTIYHMMNKKFDLPFMDLHSLFQNSKYELLAFKGSMVNQLLQKKIGKYVMNSRNAARVFYTSSTFELYNEICFSKKKRLAIFEAEDHHKTMGKLFCQLVPTKKSYFTSSIASGVKRGYRYKRSFDIGIMKLAETGLISAIRTRWINWKVVGNNDIPFQSIDISQVYLTFIILLLGYIVSIIILIIEYMTYFRTKNVNLVRN